jgi:RNA polymerase sigma-70 factor (ECF subfamily)
VAHVDGAVVSVYAFDIADGRIRRIWAVLNPEKLRSWKSA